MAKNYLDKTGLTHFWAKIKAWVEEKNYITLNDVPEGAAASSTVPEMDGTAAAGTETAFARGDHVHPKDTSKVDKVTGKGLSTNDYTNADKNKLAGIEENANNYVLPDASLNVKGGVKLINEIPSNEAGTSANMLPIVNAIRNYVAGELSDTEQKYISLSMWEPGSY